MAMKIEDENIEWKKEAPQLASLAPNNPYTVPQNYFSELIDQTNQMVLMNKLVQKGRPNFNVPKNYFEESESQILTKVKLLQINKKTNGFGTPKNYFETLDAKIIAQTTPKQTNRFKLWNNNFFKYAAAASVVVITMFVILLNKQNPINANQNAEFAAEQLLYQIDESVIIEHIQENNSTSKAVNKDLENYILDNFSTIDIANNL
jgi:hypothetical protein